MWIQFQSYMSKGVDRSPVDGEVIAFIDRFDVASALSAELALVFGHKVPV